MIYCDLQYVVFLFLISEDSITCFIDSENVRMILYRKKELWKNYNLSPQRSFLKTPIKARESLRVLVFPHHTVANLFLKLFKQ
jgi:hypothetical protein